MCAFFGIDEHKAQGLFDKDILCLPFSQDGKTDFHFIVSPIKYEDIVFIKHYTPQDSLHIKAVGIVQSDYLSKRVSGICLPVKWVWQGEKVPGNCDEELSLCGESLYEEHNILIQKEIIDLLPEKYRLPPEW